MSEINPQDEQLANNLLDYIQTVLAVFDQASSRAGPDDE